MEHKGKRMAGVLSRTFKLTTKLNCFKVISSHSAYARMLKKQQDKCVLALKRMNLTI